MGPESTFFGRYDHSLDAKGRLILPSRLRTRLGARCFLTAHLEGCLALWPGETFLSEIESRESEATDTWSRNAVREWFAKVAEVEQDNQGRILISSELREYGGLEREVIVIGVHTHVELWSPGRWASKELAPAGVEHVIGP
ncbi:MAG: division/cell wall cluster transcriptional repressor MraZ [Acidimicrobiales bacterium]